MVESRAMRMALNWDSDDEESADNFKSHFGDQNERWKYVLDIFSRVIPIGEASHVDRPLLPVPRICDKANERNAQGCLLYTSDAADEP